MVGTMPSEIEKWVESVPEEAIEEELDQLRRQALAINRRIEVREQALAIKRSFASVDAHSVPADNAGNSGRHLPGAKPTNPPFRGRDAIRRVIAQTPARRNWTIPDMLDAIHKRGWTANTHAVQVNLSRMYRDGELEKDGVGIYAVPGRQDGLSASEPEASE
jgi:hypothetical protein